jgi:hypothetical protein
MLAEVHERRRVTDGDRHGFISRILPAHRRGLPGAVADDGFVRWDDGEEEAVNPEDLFDETDDDRR